MANPFYLGRGSNSFHACCCNASHRIVRGSVKSRTIPHAPANAKVFPHADGQVDGAKILALQIGNAVLKDATDQLGMVEYAWSHAIISDELYSAVRRECDSFKEEADGGRPGKGCSPALRAFLGAYDDIDIYSIYTPTCLLPNNVSSTPRRRRPARLVAAPRLLSKHVRILRTRHGSMVRG